MASPHILANSFSYGAFVLPITEPYGLFSIQIQTTCAYFGVVLTRPHGAVVDADAAVGTDGEGVGNDRVGAGDDSEAVGNGAEVARNGGEVVAATLGVGWETRADADGGEAGVLLDAASWRALEVQAASVVTVKVTTASCRTPGLPIGVTLSIDADVKMTVP